MTKKKTHAIFVLDRSGSMASCRDATIDGYNEQLAAFRAADSKVRVTCIQFDDNWANGGICIDTMYEYVKVADAPELSPDTYQPRGGTPMLDAVGAAIAKADADQKSDAILITIISDGYENSSKEETYETIAAKIKERTDRGNWTFAYIGANQDLSVVSKRMNIPIGNTMAYAATDRGTRDMYTTSSQHRVAFAASASLSATNLFGDKEKKERAGSTA